MRLVHTGQHYDECMSGDFFRQLGIPDPDVNLEVGSGTQAEQTASIMVRYEQVLVKARSELCLVVGDVTSTMACAIAAQKLRVPVAHVEGGIRSGDWGMPEEINRLVTDAITNCAAQPLPACSANLGKRLVKAPKLHLIDDGLTAHLRGQTDPDALALSPHLGPLLESFVVQELRRQLGWADTAATIWHFRTAAGHEVDLVLEAPDQRIVGIEVKANASLGQSDFNGLRELRDAAGQGFVRGVVLYTGEQLMPFEENLWAVPMAVPMAVLWAGGGNRV